MKDVLEVKFKDKNIDDILNFTIDEAIDFFGANEEVKIQNKLQVLKDVGLGYIKLGQSSSTLSGGEAQRIKLASFLGLKNNKKLKKLGWKVYNNWECRLTMKHLDNLLKKLFAI